MNGYNMVKDFEKFTYRAQWRPDYYASAEFRSEMLSVVSDRIGAVKRAQHRRNAAILGVDGWKTSGERVARFTFELNKEIRELLHTIESLPSEFTDDVVRLLESAELESTKEQVAG